MKIRWRISGLKDKRRLQGRRRVLVGGAWIAGYRTEGTFNSFLAVHWALTLALRSVSVFMVSAKGAALARREA